MNIFVDTNVIIDYTKGVVNQLENILKQQDKGLIEIYVNPIVITEFFNDQALKNKKNLKLALELFENFKTVDIDKKTSLIAGELLRENKVNFLADALIAANCLQHSLFLFTKNKKDFKKVKGLKFYQEREAFKKSSKIK